MRPPSYYTSIANSNSYGSNSSRDLRSSLSSPTSSSYASRTHLPFVAQSALVAHCFTGVGSSTKPYINYSSSSSLASSSGSAGSSALSKGHYARSYTSSSYSNHSRPTSTSRASFYLDSPSSLSSAAASSSASSSSSDSRHLNSGYAPLPRPSYLSPSAYSPSSSSSTRSTYRPTTASTYYKPIRLRERPILRQISRQLKSTTTATSSHSNSIRSKNTNNNNSDDYSERRGQSQLGADSSQKQSSFSDREQRDADSEANWSSDVARNISRNKYLIKFKEFDRQQRPSLAQIEPTEKSQQVAPVEAAEVTSTTTTEGDDKTMRFAADQQEDPPATCAPDCDIKKTDSIDVRPKKKKTTLTAKVATTTLAAATDDKAESSAASPGEPIELKKKTPSGGKKAPVKRRNVKLKLKPIGANKATDLKPDKPKEQKEQENQGKPVAKVAPETPGKEMSNNSGRLIKVKGLVEPSSGEKVGEPREETSNNRKTNAENERPKANTVKSSGGAKKSVVGGEPNGTNKRIRFREYNYEDFNFLSVLGHGGWGFVLLAELKDHDACFAVKCIKKITIVEDDDFESILIERKVLTLGNLHPFICKLFCTFETQGYLFFVMEYCAGGDLMFHVQREGKFAESRCRFYAAEIICAIRFLHNRHIIYRDLKLDNILLDSAGHVRLVDFGMCQCRTYREEMLPSNFCGTPEYISPEIIKGVPYNHSVDWWSFGVLLYEMAVGKMPFRGNDENELLWNVCYEQIHYPMFLSKELTCLLQSLLEREPTKRMGMATCKAGDIYEQPFFRSVDWKAVEELRVKPPFVPEVVSSSSKEENNQCQCPCTPINLPPPLPLAPTN